MTHPTTALSLELARFACFVPEALAVHARCAWQVARVIADGACLNYSNCVTRRERSCSGTLGTACSPRGIGKPRRQPSGGTHSGGSGRPASGGSGSAACGAADAGHTAAAAGDTYTGHPGPRQDAAKDIHQAGDAEPAEEAGPSAIPGKARIAGKAEVGLVRYSVKPEPVDA